mmetsp:Transcript_24021/g.44403  ORF Transcript_24021/g.44403 Transcript_24021/m.44403 type:complete len:203 (-) Transcript_24021:209-817(-)
MPPRRVRENSQLGKPKFFILSLLPSSPFPPSFCGVASSASSSRIVASAELGAVIHFRRFPAGPLLELPNAFIMFIAARLPLESSEDDEVELGVESPSRLVFEAALSACWKSALVSIFLSPVAELGERGEVVEGMSTLSPAFTVADVVALAPTGESAVPLPETSPLAPSITAAFPEVGDKATSSALPLVGDNDGAMPSTARPR